MKGFAFVTVAIALSVICSPAGQGQTLAVPNTSNAPLVGSPIEIEDCSAGQSGGLLLAQSDERFRIVFTNEDTIAADLVRFQVDLGHERLFIGDVGKFSPGVAISHLFRRRGGNVISSPLFSPANLSCSVVAAHFIDGTEWNRSLTTVGLPLAARSNFGYLGIDFAQDQSGVYARLVLPASPAERVGVKQGDRIVRIDGNRLSTVRDAETLISASPPGTRLRLEIIRGGRLQNIDVVLSARPLSQL